MATTLDGNFLYDTLLELHDGTAVTADGVGSEGILDLGAGEVVGLVVIDVSALDVAGGDEHYTLQMEFSSDSAFGSGVVPGTAIGIGNNGIADTLLDNASADRGAGRYLLPFANVFNGTAYRYARLYVHGVGATSFSVTFKAVITPSRL
jgi:hypothetical protein